MIPALRPVGAGTWVAPFCHKMVLDARAQLGLDVPIEWSKCVSWPIGLDWGLKSGGPCTSHYRPSTNLYTSPATHG